MGENIKGVLPPEPQSLPEGREAAITATKRQ